LPDWKGGKQKEIIPQYIDFVSWARREADEAGIPLVLDIPFQFSRFEFGSSSLVGAVLALVDEVVVMAYRHGPEEVIESARSVVEQAEAKGKRVWIGVSADPVHLRRSQAGPATASDLDGIILQVAAAFQGKSSFVGVAIHDYDRFLDLP
jgi:hypothetical protein